MSNHLPETELANWAFLPAADKRRALEAFARPKMIPGTYQPFREVFPDTVNQQLPLFRDGLTRSSWDAVEARLIKACKGRDDLLRMNRQILAATHKYAEEVGIAANALDVLPLRIDGVDYSFGLNLLFRYRGNATIVFLDMRKSNGLSIAGRNFVFSALHHRFREAYVDLIGVQAQIWRYRRNKDRTLVPIFEGGEILRWDDMVDAVHETHRIWDEVKRGIPPARKVVGLGPLFD
jgi:hypothetical protein